MDSNHRRKRVEVIARARISDVDKAALECEVAKTNMYLGKQNIKDEPWTIQDELNSILQLGIVNLRKMQEMKSC